MASALPNPADCCETCGCSSCATITCNTNAGIEVYDTIADLRASTQHDDDEYCVVLGLAAAWDGQGGQYVFISTMATADDGITIIQPTDVSGNGRWRKFA